MGTDTVRLAEALRGLGDEVESADPDEIGSVAGMPVFPADSQFAMQWGMHNTGQLVNGVNGTADADIDAPEAWGIHNGVGSEAVIVAVLDSGLGSHLEFGFNLGPLSTGRVLPGYNTVLNSGTAANLTDNCFAGHGTHVTGIIAAAGGPACGSGTSQPGVLCESVNDCAPGCVGGTNAGQVCATDGDCPGGACGVPTCAASGVAGMSWGVYVMPVKIMTGCSGVSADLAEGIIWAADNRANVINMSVQYNLTLPSSINNVQNAIDYAHGLGVVLVAATGNMDSCGNSTVPYDVVCYPARMPNVIAVSGTDSRDLLGTFSNFGPEVDVAAPGNQIRSTISNGSYDYMFGTSMAAPHVSGLAALLKSYVPELTNNEIEEIILATAEDRGPVGWDQQFGHGRINAHQALVLASHWPGIIESNPPDGAIDAGQPVDRLTLAPLGWSHVDVRFPRNASGVASTDFVIEQTVAGAPPAIVAVEVLGEDVARLHLDRPLDPMSWTVITHVATGTRIRLGYLPGDVGGDSFTNPADILSLIDSLNGVVPRPDWSTDVDRSGVAAPADIIALIDLLNGVAPFSSYNGSSLPPIP